MSSNHHGGGAVIDPKHKSDRYQFNVADESQNPDAEEDAPLVPGRSRDGNKELQYNFGRLASILRFIRPHMKKIKIGTVFIVLVLGIIAFASNEEPEVDNIFALDNNSAIYIPLNDEYPKSFVQFDMSTQLDTLESHDSMYPFHIWGERTATTDATMIYIWVDLQQSNGTAWNSINHESLQVGNSSSHFNESDFNIQSGGHGSGNVNSVVKKVIWELPKDNQHFRLFFFTNAASPMPLELTMLQHTAIFRYKELLGAFVLGGMYILIMFELVDRTVSAILGSFLVLAMLALINARPPLEVVVTWIEYNTLALLFGMMLIVGIFSTTGFFEWIALKAFEVSKGNVWRLVVILCVVTGVSSGLLDNVTSMLLLTPVIVRLCKVIGISPVPVLIATVTMSNIGGCATAVGDPPMVIIVNTPAIIAAKIDFAEVFFFMAPGTFVIAVCITFYYKYYFRKEFAQESRPAPGPVLKLQKEIDIWSNTQKRLNTTVPEERKVKEMLDNFMFQLQSKVADEKIEQGQGPIDATGLENLKKEYVIHDRTLFIYCSCTLGSVVLMFFLENFISSYVYLPLPWIAVLGALTLMVLADITEMEMLLHKVEWSTLMFFAALFVLMEGLEQLGLVSFIGNHIADGIATVDLEYRELAAICIIVWVSAITSAIIDSIPYTTAMIPIVIQLANSGLGLHLRPLVYSLAFGTGLGGNGTLIGSTANLVCAGLAEQNGYPLSFLTFSKAGMPIMLISTAIANVYLIIVFVVFKFGVY